MLVTNHPSIINCFYRFRGSPNSYVQSTDARFYRTKFTVIMIIITASFGSHAGTPLVASSPQLTALRRGVYMIEHMDIPT
jgi:hypothetical protein